MQEVVGSNPIEGKICFLFSQITLFYRVECEQLFCKTNLKLKVLKLIKTELINAEYKVTLSLIEVLSESDKHNCTK